MVLNDGTAEDPDQAVAICSSMWEEAVRAKTHRLAVPFEAKLVGEKSIEGLGSVFGNVDLGADIVLPGAFKRSLATHAEEGTMPAMLWQHRTDQIPGAWTEAGETEEGLLLKGELADTQLGRETRILARMGAVRGMSIGGTIQDFDFDRDGNRLIKEFDVWEVSLVTFPMNPKATIAAVKSEYPTPRAFEKHLRDEGVSQKVAKTIVSNLFGSSGMDDPSQRDVDDEELLEELRRLNEDVMVRAFRSYTRR